MVTGLFASEAKAQEFLRQPLEFIDNPDFARDDVAEEFLAPMPHREEYERKQRTVTLPKNLPPELAGTYYYPLLQPDQERHLFRHMNYRKYLYSCALERLRQQDYSVLAAAETCRRDALGVQDILVCANLRLVLAVAKRYAHYAPRMAVWEVAEEAHPILVNTVLKFNYALGNKFSTYAIGAINRFYWSNRPGNKDSSERETSWHEDPIDADQTIYEDGTSHKHVQGQALDTILRYLEPRERAILELRYRSNQKKPLTLEKVGTHLRLTKERARQIERVALARATVIAHNMNIQFDLD